MCERCERYIREAEARGAWRSLAACAWVGPRMKYGRDRIDGFPSDRLLQVVHREPGKELEGA